jgi:two-component system response regulator YesN
MYKVLIVDDDKTTRYMLKRFKKWSENGFVIKEEACDGKEALKKLESGQFDLVITDIKMPGMDGIEFLNELKVTKVDICVIFLSTHSDFNYAKQGIRLGVFDYMTKPVNDDVLGETLERTKRHLDEKNLQKMKFEEERKLLEENLQFYYPKKREINLVSLLMSGDSQILEEAERTFLDISNTCENNFYKMDMLLEKVLTKLSEEMAVVYPWLGIVEKMESWDSIPYGGGAEDLKKRFVEYIGRMLETVRKYELHQPDSIVKKTCEYVLNHVEDDISLEKIAQEVHMRSDYIGKLFKKKTGYHFSDYVTKVKMEHAKYLIRTGNYKNYEVSEKLGYSSPDYFSRLFKNYTGYTPIEFRKRGI